MWSLPSMPLPLRNFLVEAASTSWNGTSLRSGRETVKSETLRTLNIFHNMLWSCPKQAPRFSFEGPARRLTGPSALIPVT